MGGGLVNPSIIRLGKIEFWKNTDYILLNKSFFLNRYFFFFFIRRVFMWIFFYNNLKYQKYICFINSLKRFRKYFYYKRSFFFKFSLRRILVFRRLKNFKYLISEYMCVYKKKKKKSKKKKKILILLKKRWNYLILKIINFFNLESVKKEHNFLFKWPILKTVVLQELTLNVFGFHNNGLYINSIFLTFPLIRNSTYCVFKIFKLKKKLLNIRKKLLNIRKKKKIKNNKIYFFKFKKKLKKFNFFRLNKLKKNRLIKFKKIKFLKYDTDIIFFDLKKISLLKYKSGLYLYYVLLFRNKLFKELSLFFNFFYIKNNFSSQIKNLIYKYYKNILFLLTKRLFLKKKKEKFRLIKLHKKIKLYFLLQKWIILFIFKYRFFKSLLVPFKKYGFNKIKLNLNFEFSNRFTAMSLMGYINNKLMSGYSFGYVFDHIKAGLWFLKNYISGYKICFSGRFTRKQIATYRWYKFLSLPLTNFSETIDYSFGWSQTRFGVYGVKIWLHIKNYSLLKKKK